MESSEDLTEKLTDQTELSREESIDSRDELKKKLSDQIKRGTKNLIRSTGSMVDIGLAIEKFVEDSNLKEEFIHNIKKIDNVCLNFQPLAEYEDEAMDYFISFANEILTVLRQFMLISNNICASSMETNSAVPEFKRQVESVQRTMRELTSSLINWNEQFIDDSVNERSSLQEEVEVKKLDIINNESVLGKDKVQVVDVQLPSEDEKSLVKQKILCEQSSPKETHSNVVDKLIDEQHKMEKEKRKRERFEDEDSAPKSKMQKLLEDEVVEKNQVEGKGRRQIYQTIIPECQQGCLPRANLACYLHVLKIVFLKTYDKTFKHTEEEVLLRSYGLLASKKFPKIPNYTFTAMEAKINASVTSTDEQVVVTEEQLSKIKRFHRFIFEDLMKFKKFFDPPASRMPVYVIPIQRDYSSLNYKIDFKYIEDSQDDQIRNSIFMVLKESTEQHKHFTEQQRIFHQFFQTIKFIPRTLYIFQSLLIAESLRAKIASSTLIGNANLPSEEEWPVFDCGCLNNIKQVIQAPPEDLKRFIPPNKDILQINNTIRRFKNSTDFKYNPGPSAGEILTALTVASTGEDYNMERAEFLGDSFLKFSTTIKLFIESPNLKTNKWHLIRENQGQNLNLYNLAEKKNLSQYIISTPYSKKSFVPPSFTINYELENIIEGEKILQDKQIADCMESLIGIYLISAGQNSAIKFMDWMGLDPLPKSVLSNTDLNDWPYNYFETNIESSNQEQDIDFQSLENSINYKFNNKRIIKNAFTIMSNEQFQKNNKQMRFLGEAIFHFLITRILYEDPANLSSGDMTAIRDEVLDKKLLACIAMKKEFHRYAIPKEAQENLKIFAELYKSTKEFIFYKEKSYCLDESETVVDIPAKFETHLSNLTFSVGAAIFVDSKGSVEDILKIYLPSLLPVIEHFKIVKPCNAIKELKGILRRKNIFEDIFEEEGSFYAVIKIKDEEVIGTASTKELAKESAAIKALRKYNHADLESI